jgi:hypothetical protein
MPPATATTTNGALSCPIRNNRTGRLDKATPRRGPQGSGADGRKKQHFLLCRAGFRPEGAAFRTAGAVRPYDLSPSGCGVAARCRLFAPERSDDVLARVSILDPDSRLTRSAVSGSSLILTPAASARALAIATAVGPRAASLVPRKGCPGRSQQRRGGSQGRSARRTRPGVSADLSRRRFAAVWAAGGGSGRLPAAANAPRTLSAQPASIG